MTKVKLNYESVKQYVVRLYVTDLGDLLGMAGSGSGSNVYDTVTDLPADHVDFIDVTVNVLDENDNIPIFNATSYAFDVIEEEPNGTYVGSVKVFLYGLVYNYL